MAASAARPFYYLDNFHLMLETLQARDGDLLAEEETVFIEKFSHLGKPTQAILVRMIMRKGPLFRADKLVYEEIGDSGRAIRPLLDLGWAEERPAVSLKDLFRMFAKRQVAAYLGLDVRQTKATKSSLMLDFSARLTEPQPYDRCCAILGRVYGLSIGRLCTQLVLMFFGNFRQSLAEFVLTDLGVFRYENVWSREPSRPFSKRAEVNAFHQLHACRSMLHEGLPPSEIEAAMPGLIADCEWLEERRQKLLFQIARQLERSGEAARALEIYSTCTHREASSRRALLWRAASGAPRTPRRTSPVPTFPLSLRRSNCGSSVEHAVRDHLLAHDAGDTMVHYVENGLFNSIFGLWCWPAIFAPLAGAFFHPFQAGPADLYSPSFYERRREQFDACFAELEQGTYREGILRRFADRQGIACPFVAWGLVDEAMLHMAIDCIPAHHLSLLFHWLLRDLKANKTGFPDLVQFWPDLHRYRLIEVKAPGDRLQNNQAACLRYMLEHDMPVTVCRVHWIEAEC